MFSPMRHLFRKFAGGQKKQRIPPQHTQYPPQDRYGLRTANVAYRRDFYVPQNIIGYAGPPARATIFFQQGTIYGHIVQWHPDPDNVGREKLDDFAHIGGGYYLDNEVINGASVAVERFIYPSGQLSPPMYVYADKFIDCRTMPQILRDMVMPDFERAIRRFYMKQPKWDGSAECI